MDFATVNPEGALLINNEESPYQSLNNYDFVFWFHEEVFTRVWKSNKEHELLDSMYSSQNTQHFVQFDTLARPEIKNQELQGKISYLASSTPLKYYDFTLNCNAGFLPLAVSSSYKRKTSGKSFVYVGRVNNVCEKIIKFSKISEKEIDLHTFLIRREIECVLKLRNYLKVRGELSYQELPEAFNGKLAGLCFDENISPNGKIWDYWSCGLPAFIEDGCIEADILRESKLGEVFDLSNFSKPNYDYLASLDIYDQVHDTHSYTCRFREWTKHIG